MEKEEGTSITLANGESLTQVWEITTRCVQLFADATGDYNPIHIDEQFAAGTKFERPIAHGKLTESYICGFLAEQFPGAFLRASSFRYPNPLYVGSSVEASITLGAVKTKRLLGLVVGRARCVCISDGIMVLEGEIDFGVPLDKTEE